MKPRTDGGANLIEFKKEEYFESDIDRFSKAKLPYIQLNPKGIDLVAQYYAYKYHMDKPIITPNVNRVIEKIKSDDFSKISNQQDEVRIPFLITGSHSTPAVYVKEKEKEYLLIFDSLGDISMAEVAAEAFPNMDIYTSKKQGRQRDIYSCHSEALFFLRELAGKNAEHHFIILNISDKLKKNVIPDTKHRDNLHEIKLFDSLLATIQNPPFMASHKDQYASKEIIHTHKGKPEHIEDFLKRYPPEERAAAGKEPNVSSYLREKGLKFSHIIEIQFYLNQLKKILGDQFTEQLMAGFIADAKSIIKMNKNTFLTEGSEQKNVYALAKTYLEKNLDLLETKNVSTANVNSLVNHKKN